MKIPIHEHIKSAIIDAWLMGKTRDSIDIDLKNGDDKYY